MLRRLLVCGVVAALGAGASSPARADPPPSQPLLWRHLELEVPLLKPLRFSFSSDPVPGFEPLRLPTFRSQATWLERGELSFITFTQVAPALELDCSLTCQPMLERTLAGEGRFNLGALAPVLPSSYFYVRAQQVQSLPSQAGAGAPQKFRVLGVGLAGLLNF